MGTIVGPHTIWFRDIQDRVSRLKHKSQTKARLNRFCAIHPLLISICTSIIVSAASLLQNGSLSIITSIFSVGVVFMALKWFSQLLILPAEVWDIAKDSNQLSVKESRQAMKASIAILMFSLFPILAPVAMMMGTPATTVLAHPLMVLLSIFATGTSFYMLRKILIKIEPQASALASKGYIKIRAGRRRCAI